MKNLFYGFCLLSILFFNHSCGLLDNPCGDTKEEFLDNYNTFLQKISEANLERDASEWIAHDAKFEKLIKECYKEHEDELGTFKKIEFWKNAGKYYVYRYGGDAATMLLDKDNPVSQLIVSNLDIIPGVGTAVAIYNIIKAVSKSGDNDMANEAKDKIDLNTLKELF